MTSCPSATSPSGRRSRSATTASVARPRRRPGPGVPAPRPLAGGVDQPGGRGGPGRARQTTTPRTRSRRWSTPTCSSRPTPGWYRFHDLLRVYATERALAEEPEAARDEAVRRLLLVVPGDRGGRRRYDLAAPLPSASRAGGGRGYPPLDFGGVEEALAWYDDERANFAAATRQAAAAGLHDIAWRLPPTLFPPVQPAEQLGGLRDHAPRRRRQRAQGRRPARRGVGAQPAWLRAGPAA